MEMLKALIICGAKRCPSSKSGCVSGCADDKMLHILKKPASLPDVKAQVRSPTSLVQQFEDRQFEKEQYRYNKILDWEHNAIYKDMITALNEMANQKPNSSNIINCLSLDGGGIRGLVITQVIIMNIIPGDYIVH
jgi:hypothetical protein